MQRLVALTLLISTLSLTGCVDVVLTGFQTSGDASQVCANPNLPSFLTITCN
jgi:hypothetical protein